VCISKVLNHVRTAPHLFRAHHVCIIRKQSRTRQHQYTVYDSIATTASISDDVDQCKMWLTATKAALRVLYDLRSMNSASIISTTSYIPY
jgi:hypothetical protein